MKLVKFVRHYSSYNVGETAGFEDTQAAELVQRGAAIFLVKDVPAVAKDTPVVVAGVAAGADAEHSFDRHGRRK